MHYGYARVSTKTQARDGNGLQAQEAALIAAGAEVIVHDAMTGKRMERPALQELLGRLQDGDTLTVTKLDRFARSISQASDLITALIDRGVTVQVLNLGVLSNDSVSTLLRNVLLSFAQFERDMIVERTSEGKAIARTKKGYREGRPRAFTREQLDLAMDLLQDYSYTQVSRKTSISRSTLIREAKRRNCQKSASAVKAEEKAW